MPTFSNWNGSSVCKPSRIETPRSEEEIRTAVRRACREKKRLRFVGRGVHTYGKLSMCDPGDMIVNLRRFNRVIEINKTAKTITAQAGIALEDLIPYLEDDQTRLALRNMGEISEQCLGGVTATATHGSGGGPSGLPDSFGDQVVRYKVMECTPQANVHVIDRTHPAFSAFLTHLGCLGVVLEVTLQLVDWYHLQWQTKDIGTYDDFLKIDIRKEYERVYSLGYTFFPSTDEMVEVIRDKVTENVRESGIANEIKEDFVSTLRQGATCCTRLFPCCVPPYAKFQKRALLTLKGTDQWRKVLSQGDLFGGVNLTLITDLEYAVPMGRTFQALGIIREILQKDCPNLLTVVGIRFVRASPSLLACHSDVDYPSSIFAYLNVQLRTKQPDMKIVERLESRMMSIGGRPHWGKLNTTSRKHISNYKLWPGENVERFLEVKQAFDPNNIMGNDYLDRALGRYKSGGTLVDAQAF